MRLRISVQNTHSRFFSAICLITFFAFAPLLVQAQITKNYCEPTQDIKAALKKVSEIDNSALPFKAAREQKLEQLRALIKQYPDDLFIHRAYQNAYTGTVDRDHQSLIAEYRAWLEKNPDDPVYLYLYGNLLIGTNTKEALGLIEKAIQKAPNLALAYQALANIHQVPAYHDKAKVQESLKQSLAACPSTLSLYSPLVDRQVDDPVLLQTGAQKLRELLKNSTDPDDLRYYDHLWQLEFRLKPVAEHAQVRKQVEADIQRLREMNTVFTERLLSVLRSGYKQISNDEGVKWAEKELLERFPHSSTTALLILEQWRESHPFPAESSPEKKQAYYEALFRESEQWLKRSPENTSFLARRFSAASQLTKLTDAEFDRIADEFLRSLERNAGSLASTPPFTTQVAEAYLKRNLHL
ncbi:MAG TPA: hypothetical protein VEF04_11265, partial [Blastocatellia bacterium]|nr:hypothetical protein [Blastocatellia bacterium]